MDGLFAVASDDVEIGGATELPNSGTYHGRQGRWCNGMPYWRPPSPLQGTPSTRMTWMAT